MNKSTQTVVKETSPREVRIRYAQEYQFPASLVASHTKQNNKNSSKDQESPQNPTKLIRIQ
jgi:hypothetical protein